MAKPLPTWKKGLGISLALSITAALFLLAYNFDEETLEVLLYLRTEYLLVATLMIFSLWIIEGIRVKLFVATVSHGKTISLFDGMQIYLMTFFFAAVTPFAAGEWPAHIYALKRHGLSIGEATAITVLRAFVTRILFTLAAIFLLLYFQGHPIPVFLHKVFVYAVFGSILSSLVLFFLVWKPLILQKLLHKLSFMAKGKRSNKIYAFLQRELGEYCDSTRSINRWNGGGFLLITILTAAYWIFFFSIAPVLLLGLNRAVPFSQALFWQLIIQMFTFYIPLPGGSGVVELSAARLYSFFVPASVLGLFVLSWRFFTYYLLLFFGGLVALNKIKL